MTLQQSSQVNDGVSFLPFIVYNYSIMENSPQVGTLSPSLEITPQLQTLQTGTLTTRAEPAALK